MLLKNVYLCLLLEGKANEEVYEKIGLLLIAVMMILPAMAQVSFGVRAGGAYSSLIQKWRIRMRREPLRFQHSGFGGYSFE